MEQQIEKNLRKALLLDGEMNYALYEFELKEHIDYWKKGMYRDKEEFLFVVTENNGDVAMLLITERDELIINENARHILQLLWNVKDIYKKNIERLLPVMAEQLENGILSVNGVKTQKALASR